MTDTSKYIEMQQDFYTPLARQWDMNGGNINHVVGWWHEHNAWPGYEHLFAGLDLSDMKKMVALDFGTGPGRNIVKYWNRFARIDGVDFIPTNIENAKRLLAHHQLDNQNINLYTCNGKDLQNIPDEQYDMVFSTITMQHICVYDIRFNYLKEFHRILRPNGYIAIQMGFGRKENFKTRRYYDNFYDATATNGDDYGSGCVAVEDVNSLASDLAKIGFKNTQYVIDEPFLGEHDTYPQWIYFRSQK